MRVEIESWFAVASWRWEIPNDTACSICQNPYEMPCNQCKYGGDDCAPI